MPPRARMRLPATFPVDDRRAAGRRPALLCRTCEGSEVQAVIRTAMGFTSAAAPATGSGASRNRWHPGVSGMRSKRSPRAGSENADRVFPDRSRPSAARILPAASSATRSRENPQAPLGARSISGPHAICPFKPGAFLAQATHGECLAHGRVVAFAYFGEPRCLIFPDRFPRSPSLGSYRPAVLDATGGRPI